MPTERHERRQGLTCLYRCGNACAHDEPNRSGNEYFGDVLARAVSRRGVLRAGAVLTLVAGAGTAFAGSAPAATGAGSPAGSDDLPRGLSYKPVTPGTADAVTVPAGYRSEVVIRWGDP